MMSSKVNNLGSGSLEAHIGWVAGRNGGRDTSSSQG